MAYTEAIVTDMSGVASALLSFMSTSLAWQVDGVAGTFTIPNGMQFTITEFAEPLDVGLDFTCSAFGNVPAGFGASIVSPKTGTQTAPTFVNPTRVHLFGEPYLAGPPETTPWCGMVVEYGAHAFRTFWVGRLNMCAPGATGGSCIASSLYSSYYLTTRAYGGNLKYPFAGMAGSYPTSPYMRTESYSGSLCGGVHFEYPGLVGPAWRRFFYESNLSASISYPDYPAANDAAAGGFQDGILDMHVRHNFVPWASRQALVPVNIYAIEGQDTAARFYHAGAPPGVAYVNVRGMVPGQEIVVSTDTWKVFPVFQKGPATWASAPSGQLHNSESSGEIGIAFLK